MLQRMSMGLAWALLGAAGAAVAQADTPLMHGLFTDHAVLQRDQPIVVYGRATPGEEVTVTLADSTATVAAAADGRWSGRLPARAAGGPYSLTARSGAITQLASHVLVGDVWLCSGQSNMEWPVRMTLDAGNEAALSANPRIRHVTIPRGSSAGPR